MSQIFDRRPNSRHKSAVNRRRFLQRFKKQIKAAVANAVAKRSITDFEHGEKINIPTKDTHEPRFFHGEGGKRTIVLPGNKEFSRGDKIPKPESMTDEAGSKASNTGEGEDTFAFELSREEFMQIFFDDLELPRMLKKKLGREQSFNMVRSGYSKEGNPTNLNIPRSMRSALARRVALTNPLNKKIKKLEAEQEQTEDEAANAELADKIVKLKHKVDRIPFIDPFDLRYNRKTPQPVPTTKAVVFCLMDVSGSMDETKKEMAKRFFILLYLFLKRNYETIELVFIRHHTSAKEVDEEEFFYSRETGGTVVSSALELMNDIINDRYPTNEWNIYGAQASDGDNWNNDSPRCGELLTHNIMPHVQYFAYVEILPRHHQSLWEEYEQVHKIYKNFAMQTLEKTGDIYPVFRELFKRQEVNAHE